MNSVHFRRAPFTGSIEGSALLAASILSLAVRVRLVAASPMSDRLNSLSNEKKLGRGGSGVPCG